MDSYIWVRIRIRIRVFEAGARCRANQNAQKNRPKFLICTLSHTTNEGVDRYCNWNYNRCGYSLVRALLDRCCVLLWLLETNGNQPLRFVADQILSQYNRVQRAKERWLLHYCTPAMLVHRLSLSLSFVFARWRFLDWEQRQKYLWGNEMIVTLF
jgi:hypothetical protein